LHIQRNRIEHSGGFAMRYKSLGNWRTHLIYRSLDDFSKERSKLNLNATYQRAFELMVQVGNAIQPCYWSEIESGMKGIQWAVEKELLENTFVFIPSNKMNYFKCDDDKALFCKSVYENFKSARADIKDAGNCLAADLNTAAVFHLMCVVNIGLLALAKHLKLKIKAIEFQEWKNIIDGRKRRRNPPIKIRREKRSSRLGILQWTTLKNDLQSVTLRRN